MFSLLYLCPVNPRCRAGVCQLCFQNVNSTETSCDCGDYFTLDADTQQNCIGEGAGLVGTGI